MWSLSRRGDATTPTATSPTGITHMTLIRQARCYYTYDDCNLEIRPGVCNVSGKGCSVLYDAGIKTAAECATIHPNTGPPPRTCFGIQHTHAPLNVGPIWVVVGVILAIWAAVCAFYMWVGVRRRMFNYNANAQRDRS